MIFEICILEILKGYQIPFLSQPLQQQFPREIHPQSKRKICSRGGDWKSLEKSCNSKSSYEKGFCQKSLCEESISSEEKGFWQQTCHQFEEFKSVHPPPLLQDEEPEIIEEYSQAKKLHVQIRSKECLFLHPTCGRVEEIREILLGEGPILIPVSMLWTCSSPYIFTILLKIPIVFLRRIGTLITIYLDYVLLIGKTVENVQMYCDTVMLLLQELGFVKNLKKSVMTLSQEMEFLGMVINSREMTISLPEKKLQKVEIQCLDMYQNPQMPILKLTKVLGHLMSTIQTALPV